MNCDVRSSGLLLLLVVFDNALLCVTTEEPKVTAPLSSDEQQDLCSPLALAQKDDAFLGPIPKRRHILLAQDARSGRFACQRYIVQVGSALQKSPCLDCRIERGGDAGGQSDRGRIAMSQQHPYGTRLCSPPARRGRVRRRGSGLAHRSY